MQSDNQSAERVIPETPTRSTFFTTVQQVPKNLIVIFLLEAITVYGLLFFITPTHSANSIAQSADYELVTSDTIFQLTNSVRNEHGIDSLVYNTKLDQAALAKANYILDTDNFAHESVEGNSFSAWVQETGYSYVRVGENLAINFEEPDKIVEAWLESPTHRRNVLNPLFEEIGLAVVSGTYHNKETIVVVQLFGSPQ